MKKKRIEFNLYVRRGRTFIIPTIEFYDYDCGNCDVRHKGVGIYFLHFIFDFTLIVTFQNVQRNG